MQDNCPENKGRRLASPFESTRLPSESARAGGQLIEDQLAVADRDLDGLARLDVAAEDFLGERVLQIFFDGPPQRPRAVLWIVAFLDEEVGRRGREHDLDVLEFHAAFDLGDLDRD